MSFLMVILIIAQKNINNLSFIHLLNSSTMCKLFYKEARTEGQVVAWSQSDRHGIWGLLMCVMLGCIALMMQPGVFQVGALLQLWLSASQGERDMARLLLEFRVRNKWVCNLKEEKQTDKKKHHQKNPKKQTNKK